MAKKLVVIGESDSGADRSSGRFEICSAFERLGGSSRIVKFPAEICVEDRWEAEWFQDAYALHFDAEAIRESRMKAAHEKTVIDAKEAGVLVSFIPNLQPAHWNSEMAMKLAVEEFLPLVDIVKVSEEELEFVAGTTNVEEAAAVLLQGQTKLFIYTQGIEGSMAFTRDSLAEGEGIPEDMFQTEGVEEKFLACFLYCMYRDGVTAENAGKLDPDTLKRYLDECVSNGVYPM